MAAKIFANAPRSASDAVARFQACFVAKDGTGEVDMQAVLLFGVSVLCIVMPLELGQITFALVGAAVYAAVQGMRKTTKKQLQNRARKVAKIDAEQRVERPAPRGGARERRPAQGPRSTPEKPEFRQPSAQPVAAPTFRASEFDVQVKELLALIAPSPQSDTVMRSLAAAAKRSLQDLIPNAEVVAFASGDVMRGTAFGVAVPEVDIILNAEPEVLAERLRMRTARPIPRAAQLDARKLQKSSLRACTDELVASGVFKFRRSAFKGMEPKVTLLATGFGEKAIPVDFSVNTVAPLYNTALLTECGQIDARAKDLVLLVRRWAKDRGVSHAAKGHLSPYAWTVLSIYFMQVRSEQDGPPLTKLKAFAMASQKRVVQQEQQQKQEELEQQKPAYDACTSKSAASLFTDFFRFYAGLFDWRNECVCVRGGKRAPPPPRLPLHIVVLEDGTTAVAPSIEDPFEPARNLGSLMTTVSLARLREEISRAHQLCDQNASLSELLEPWVPPERGAAPGAEVGDSPSPDEV